MYFNNVVRFVDRISHLGVVSVGCKRGTRPGRMNNITSGKLRVSLAVAGSTNTRSRVCLQHAPSIGGLWFLGMRMKIVYGCSAVASQQASDTLEKVPVLVLIRASRHLSLGSEGLGVWPGSLLMAEKCPQKPATLTQFAWYLT